ncbi:MAG: rhomboid family intramembrane serine protease [Flavobacteriales bacterium]
MGRITDTVKALIIVNVLFFVGSLILKDTAYGLLSMYYFEHPSFRFWQPITHMFMHGGFMHILFNMYALWAFGSPLESVWGKNKFLFFYFSAGLGAALIHTLVSYFQFHQGFNALMSTGISDTEIWKLLNETLQAGSYRDIPQIGTEMSQQLFTIFNTPVVGASGAIYGVLVAFGMMYPNSELMLIFFPFPIKAKYFIPGLILIDLFSGVTGFSIFGAGIAHFAHIGGALFGFIMAWYWKKNSFNNHRWN